MKPNPRSFAIDAIEKVEFFKRDELTTDLICCEIVVSGETGSDTWFFHEDAPGWDDTLRLVEQLPGFDQDWAAKVIQPLFAESRTVAFERIS